MKARRLASYLAMGDSQRASKQQTPKTQEGGMIRVVSVLGLMIMIAAILQVRSYLLMMWNLGGYVGLGYAVVTAVAAAVVGAVVCGVVLFWRRA